MLIESPTMPPRLLPLEEPKPQPLRKPRWWQRKHSDAVILRRAAEVIDERGWTRGVHVASNGRVCMLGAIGVAAVEAGRKNRWYRLAGANFNHQVMYAGDALVGGKLRSKIWLWNDGQARSAKHVKAALAELAERAEANGGKLPRG